MKITLTNNYYQGLAVNKNSQNKKNIQNNRTVTNSVAFGGPQLTRRAASNSAARATQALARTTQRAVRLFNVERKNSVSKDKIVNINGIVYKNPEYYQGTKIIKSCVLAIRTFKNQTDGRTAETYANPEYDQNGNIISCESVTTKYNGRDDRRTAKTYEKPNFAANGQLTGCAKLTYGYQGRGDGMTSKSYLNFKFTSNDSDRAIYKSKILEYKGFEPNMTKQILVDPTYDKNGNLIGCDRLTYEYQEQGGKQPSKLYINPKFHEGTKKIKFCETAIFEYVPQADEPTAEIYEKPNFAANGQLTGCAKLTYGYQGRGDGMTSKSYLNFKFTSNDSDRAIYKSKILEYKGFEPNMTKQILVDPTYDQNGNIISCESVITKYNGRDDGRTAKTYEKPNFAANGKLTGCAKLTYEYKGRDDKKTKEYIEKPKYDENGKIVSCRIKEITYDEGRPDKLQLESYQWPTYGGNRKLTECGQVTYRFYKGQEDKVKSETYTGYVKFDKKGYVAECLQVNTRYYEDRGDRRTAKTYENPKYDENGNLIGCKSLTYEYQGREDNLVSYELQAPVYDNSRSLISFQTQSSYYQGRNDKMAAKVIDNQGNEGTTRTIIYENGEVKTEKLI